MSVCLSALMSEETTYSNFTKCSVHVICVHGSVVLCISGFLDDVMFSHNGTSGPE